MGKFGAQTHRQFDADGRQVRRRMLSGEKEVFATTLVALLIHHFGSVEWFEWDPDTLGQEVEDDFSVQMPMVVRDKIWALVSSLMTDRFYNDPLFFNHVCNALAGGPTPMQELDPATLEEVAWGVMEVRLSDHESDGTLEPFGPEVQGFVAAILHEEDIKPFPPLEFAPDLGQGEAYTMPEDPGMVSARFKDLQDRQSSIQDLLLKNVERLHRELDVLQLPEDERQQKPGLRP